MTEQRALDFTAPWLGQGNFDKRFQEWLRSTHGRAIYAECRARALQLRRSGWSHFGIGCIWESVRYELATRGVDRDGFKCNDHFRSRVARKLMADEPELAGFFETRRLRT